QVVGGMGAEEIDRHARWARGLGAMSQSVDGGQEHAPRERFDQGEVPGQRLAGQGALRYRPPHAARDRYSVPIRAHSTHFLTVTVVPLFTSDTIVNSSMR